MRSVITILISFVLLLSSQTLWSQNSKTELEKENQKLSQEIAYTNKLLKETNKNKEATINQLYLIRKKINKREKLIQNITSQISTIEKQIKVNEGNIQELNKELEQLKDEYAKMVYFAWKNKSTWNKWMFILAAEDFNQAYQRMRYFQQYADFRKKQAELITQNSEKINQENQKLSHQKEDKNKLMSNEREEQNQLLNEKDAQNKVHAELSQQEKELKKEIKEKQRQSRKLQKKIKAIIAEEIRKERERIARLEAENAKKNNNDKVKPIPIDLNLEKTFVANKGKLPWPVSQGFISSRFGKHAHAVVKSVQEDNKGIDIVTNKGQSARAIFDGTVTAVTAISSYNKVVLIKHGNYYSLYSKLDEVSVKQGDKVVAGQKLGSIFTDPITGKTEISLQIWKNTSPLNPEYWIKKQSK